MKGKKKSAIHQSKYTERRGNDKEYDKDYKELHEPITKS